MRVSITYRPIIVYITHKQRKASRALEPGYPVRLGKELTFFVSSRKWINRPSVVRLWELHIVLAGTRDELSVPYFVNCLCVSISCLDYVSCSRGKCLGVAQPRVQETRYRVGPVTGAQHTFAKEATPQALF